MADTPATLTIAGLPPLTWEPRVGWGCTVRLPEWDSIGPAYGDLPQGVVPVTFGCSDVFSRTPPTASQVASFGMLTTSGEAILDEILSALLDQVREWPGEDQVADLLGQPLAEPFQLARLIGLTGVSIPDQPPDGEGRADLDFSCEWDPEHGFMAVVTGGRATYVGPR